MNKRICLVTAMVLCIVCLFAGSAFAASGTYEGLSWDLTNGTLTLSGTLANTEVRSVTSWPWNSQRNQIQKVQFESGTVLQGSLAYMFQDCTTLTEVNFNGVDTSNVWTFRDLFRGDIRLTTLTGLQNLNTAALRQTANMFYGCSALQSVTLFNWNTSFVSDEDNEDAEEEDFLPETGTYATAENMFNGCSSLTSITFGSTFNTSKVVSFAQMFRNCSSLTSLVLPRDFNTEKAFNFSMMFYGCSNLESLTLPEKFNTINGMILTSVYGNCPKLCSVTILSDISPFKGRPNYGSEWTSLDAYTVLPEPPTNADYTGKWILDTGGEAYSIDSLMMEYDETKTGTYVWQETVYSGTVIYDPNEGTLVGSTTITVDADHKVIVLPDSDAITRLHYIFGGWQHATIGTIYDGGSSYTVPKGRTTLRAVWTYTTLRDYYVEHYQILPDLSGYTLVSTEKFQADVGTWVSPAPNDYNGFASPEAQRVQVADDDSTRIKYYYDRPGYAVMFDGNGADMGSMPSQVFTVGIQGDLMENQYIRKGWIFTGWNTKPDGSGQNYTDGQSILNLADTNNAKVTLYAQWLDNTGNTLVPTDGVVEITLTAGQTLVIPDLPAGVTYEIEEIGMGDGWSFVEDENTTGTIGAGETSEATVKNRYDAEGDITLRIYKSEVNGLTGLNQSFEEGQYEFEVVDQNDVVVSTGTNGQMSEDEIMYDDDGNEVANSLYQKAVVEFEPIHYSTADLGQTYSYTIREKNVPEHYTTDGPITVSVRVQDHMDGTIDGIISYNHNQTMVNTDHSGGRLVIKKTGYGDVPAGEQFEFTLTLKTAAGAAYTDDVHGVIHGVDPVDPDNVIDTNVVIRSGDTIVFGIGDTVEFVLPVGTKYEVVESEKNSWTLVGMDNARGTIIADRTVEAEFTNAYNLDGALFLEATKTLEGGDFVYEIYGKNGDVVGTEVRSFMFQVLDETGNTVATGQNDEEGHVAFTAIPFESDDVGKTFHYTVQETIPVDQSGYNYDRTVYNVTVVVGSDNGEMTFDTTINDGEVENMVFTNEIVNDVDLEIPCVKELTGRPFREGDKWTFTIDSDNGPVPAEYEKEVDAFHDPEFLFTLHFTSEDLGTNASKVFTYTITESGSVVGVRNDSDPHTVTVTLSRNGSALVAVIDEDNSDSLTWVNEMMEGVKLPGTGSMTAIYVALIGLLIIGAAWILFWKKHVKE